MHGVTNSIELTFDGQAFMAPAEQLPGKTSRHTGAELDRLRAEIDAVGSEAKEKASQLIADASEAAGAPLQGANGVAWVVEQYSSSYSSADPSTTSYNVTLRRHEPLNATAVELPGSLSFLPEKYKEVAEDDELTIQFLATLTASDAEELEARVVTQRAADTTPYFDVIRRGIQETATPMRFGSCYWQALEGEQRRYLIVLVSPEHDANDTKAFLGFNEPELSRLKDAVVRLQERVGQLTQTIQGAGISVPEPPSLTAAEEAQRLRQFEKVGDVVGFWLP
jgi:hypothetical protein